MDTGAALRARGARCSGAGRVLAPAGHETTSGLLSFALYFLVKHPDVMARAQAEVDRVLGMDTTPRFEHLAQLPYLEQVLKETLRMWPPAPSWGRRPFEDTVIGGKYVVKRHQPLAVLTQMLHRDPKVWGEDPDRFDPDRFAPEAAALLPANAWKPFGTGQRACIGSQFALTEAHLFLASMLQRFDLIEHDPSYQLTVKETLTFKPTGFFLRAKPRGARSINPRSVIAAPVRPLQTSVPAAVAVSGTSTPLLVLYGSNSGSAEAFAQRIAADAQARGYASEIGVLNDHVGQLPTAGAVIVVTASYEGQPAGLTQTRDALFPRDTAIAEVYARLSLAEQIRAGRLTRGIDAQEMVPSASMSHGRWKRPLVTRESPTELSVLISRPLGSARRTAICRTAVDVGRVVCRCLEWPQAVPGSNRLRP